MHDISRRGFLKVVRNGIAAAGLVAAAPTALIVTAGAAAQCAGAYCAGPDPSTTLMVWATPFRLR